MSGPFTKQRTKETEYYFCTRWFDLVVTKEKMMKSRHDRLQKMFNLEEVNAKEHEQFMEKFSLDLEIHFVDGDRSHLIHSNSGFCWSAM